jgi:hypothetical protein
MTERAVVLDQVRALIDEEFVLAIRAQKLDAGVAEILVMDVEFLVAFGTAGIEMLDHLGLLVGVVYQRCWLELLIGDRLPCRVGNAPVPQPRSTARRPGALPTRPDLAVQSRGQNCAALRPPLIRVPGNFAHPTLIGFMESTH